MTSNQKIQAASNRKEMISLGKVSDDAFISATEIRAFCVPVGAQTLNRWVKESRFPAPFSATGRARLWRYGDVRKWMQAVQGRV